MMRVTIGALRTARVLYIIGHIHRLEPRTPDIGNPDIFIGLSGGLVGSTLPLSATKADRIAVGDPRPSIEERYSSKEEYLDQVRAAAQTLVDQGYMLAEDLDEVMERASFRYDYFSGTG